MKLFQYVDQHTATIGLFNDGFLNFSKAYQWYQQVVNDEPAVALTSIDQLLRQTDDLIGTANAVVNFAKKHQLLPTLKIADPIAMVEPVYAPGKIICVGKNYEKHAKETSSEAPKEPIYFSKEADCIIGPDQEVRFPMELGRVDPELELAVIIGKKGHNISEADALDYVAGYTILNDITARDLQQEAKDTGHPWYRSKNYPTFCPIGPYLTLTDDISDPQNLEMTLKVNGEVRQQENTSQMIFSVATLIATISKHLPLNPGDIIATGTPHGIAPILNGDELELTIEGIGMLRNTVNTEA